MENIHIIQTDKPSRIYLIKSNNMNTFLRFFKIWVCFIPSLLFWLISHPFNVVFLLIPEGIYWFITAGRSLMDDGESFSKWVLTI